jgi:hypothetical protein
LIVLASLGSGILSGRCGDLGRDMPEKMIQTTGIEICTEAIAELGMLDERDHRGGGCTRK